MKRVLSAVVLLAFVHILHLQPIHADVTSIQIQIDGAAITTDVEPEMKNNRTMVPLRVIGENLGARVDWSGSEITITKNNRQIKLQLNKDSVIMDGISIPLDAKPYVKNSRTMVPLRFTAEAFGCEVNYHDHSVTIHSDPLVIDGVEVKSLQRTYWMTNSENIFIFKRNTFISALYDLFIINQGDEVEAPEHYSRMFTIDIFGSYTQIAEFQFLDAHGNLLKEYEPYELIRGIPGANYEGFAEMLLYDKTEDRWYVLSRDAYETISDMIWIEQNIDK